MADLLSNLPIVLSTSEMEYIPHIHGEQNNTPVSYDQLNE